MSVLRKAVTMTGAAALVGAAVWAMWPQPTPVDLATVSRGPLEVTLAAEGVTRVREPYTITAPISGSITRSPVQVGDRVIAGQSVVAVIQPVDPGLMDARSRAQAEAALAEARAALSLTETSREGAISARDYTEHQLERARILANSGTITLRMLEDMEQAMTAANHALAAAEAERDLARAALMRAEAQFVGPGEGLVPNGEAGECCVRILAPLTGTVLAIADRNARQIGIGAPLVTIGDIEDLEIEIDLLSADTVRVPPQAPARVTRWGGEGELAAQVRRIEPAAFTRISALGIEEQRVRLQLDLLTPPEQRQGLGDGFRILVHVVIWQADDVVQLPHGALFRHAGGWAVFVAEGGTARLTSVETGARGAQMTQITAGLQPGAQVVMFPPNALAEGARIVAR